MSAPALPDEVASYVEERELCEHFRSEPFEGSEPAQLERREFLRQSIDIHCAGTDRRLAALKRRYRHDAAVMAALAPYEPDSEAPCP